MGDADLAEADVELVALGLLAGLADRHHDAAPIGVLAGAGGLDQRRIGDRERDALGRLAARRALDVDRDELARAFAVAHHLMGEIAQELSSARRKAAARGSAASSIGGASLAAPVANSISVSEVEVSLSTVIALNERLHRFRQHRLQRAAATARR